MDLACFLVCIVEPNAAGKSSFLDALVRFNPSDDFEDAERTRAEGEGQVSTSLRARFDLDDEDRAVLPNTFPRPPKRRRLTSSRTTARAFPTWLVISTPQPGIPTKTRLAA